MIVCFIELVVRKHFSFMEESEIGLIAAGCCFFQAFSLRDLNLFFFFWGQSPFLNAVGHTSSSQYQRLCPTAAVRSSI